MKIEEITPASGDRWSRTFVKSSSQHQFNPISPNSLDDGFTPPPFLLPWLQHPGIFPTRGHPYALLAPSWPSSFFHHFSNTLLYRFWLDFGPQLGAKIPPKSDLEPFFSTFEVASYDFQDFEGCIARNARFWGPEASRKAPKIDPNSKKRIRK